MTEARGTGDTLAQLRHRVVVSCQASPGSPLRRASVIARMAASVVGAGAAGVRIDSPQHITAVKKAVDVPLIGLWKAGVDGVYITPTLKHALAVAEAGADIVAIDGTARRRPDGLELAEVIRRLHSELGAVVLADVASVADGLAAAECGADAVATTLVGLVGIDGDGSDGDGSAVQSRGTTPGPPLVPASEAGAALQVLTELTARLDVPVIAEGGITSPAEARAAIAAGAWCVVVGKAITSPDWLTARFVQAVTDHDGGGGRPGRLRTRAVPGLKRGGRA
jgi:N-acylglucosamine-6-phosphate 2-epimerase